MSHGSGSGNAITADTDAVGVGQDTTTPPDPGVIGIPVALETVSRMGGHITVANEEGQPANIQFTIRLGFDDDESSSRPVVSTPSPLEQPILIIADALDDRRSIVKTLSESRLSLVVASSADEWADTRRPADADRVVPALAVIASSRDSFADCDRFQELDATIPVIVIASSGQRGDAARCRERGVRGYLANPVEPGDLVDAITSTMALVESEDTATLVTRHWLADGRRSLHVLVVDDSSTGRFLMTRMLEHRGHTTASASDGSEAIEAFDQGVFDVVLMDIMMPGIDGLEATRLIRSKDAGSAQPPLIVGVSALKDQDSRDRGHEAGMDCLLTKPVRPDDLFTLIEQQTPAVSVHTS